MNSNLSSTKTMFMQDDVQMIVHELRNPLTAISLANRSLHNELINGNSTLSAFTTIVSKNITKMEELLKQLIHLKDDQAPIKTPVNLQSIIDNCLEKVSDSILMKKMRVIKNINPRLSVHANDENLSIAFLNIIVNAVEAVDHAAGKIWITAFKKNEEVKISIKDNGSGMPVSVSAQMFDKYFSTKNSGLGVGLWNTKKILDWHNAAINVNSEPGIGTTIIMTMKGV